MISCKELALMLYFGLMIVQQPLAARFGVFSYLDEIPALLYLIQLAMDSRTGIRYTDDDVPIISSLIVFVFVGLLANVIFGYQSPKYVFIDLLTNLKFVLTIYFAIRCFPRGVSECSRLPRFATIVTWLLFVAFVADRFINIFGGELRFGMRSSMLFFGHPTYLAGCCAFLIALLCLYGSRRNHIPIALCMVMMLFTLRAKAFASVAAFALLYIVVNRPGAKLSVGQIAVVAVAAILVALPSIRFYYVTLSGESARSVMLTTSLKILRDYFPFGTGFGTFASHSAAVTYSPVYVKYGFENIYDLSRVNPGAFFDDQFWPIIFGQTGVIGTVAYLVYLATIFKLVQRMSWVSGRACLAAMFIFIYLMISSFSESAFNNTIAVPLALVMGLAVSTCYNSASQREVTDDLGDMLLQRRESARRDGRVTHRPKHWA